MIPIVANYMKSFQKIPKRVKQELEQAHKDEETWEWQQCFDEYYQD